MGRLVRRVDARLRNDVWAGCARMCTYFAAGCMSALVATAFFVGVHVCLHASTHMPDMLAWMRVANMPTYTGSPLFPNFSLYPSLHHTHTPLHFSQLHVFSPAAISLPPAPPVELALLVCLFLVLVFLHKDRAMCANRYYSHIPHKRAWKWLTFI